MLRIVTYFVMDGFRDHPMSDSRALGCQSRKSFLVRFLGPNSLKRGREVYKYVYDLKENFTADKMS